ncbi:MAG: RAD55 family ATPase [Candidatus Hodarchaeota archaeon]
MNRNLEPIGIPVIDQFIVGLPRDSVILIIGDPGSGFSTFLHQLLVFRSNSGIPAIYTSLDKSEREIQNDLAAFGWKYENLKWYFNDLSSRAKQQQSRTLQWDQDAINVIFHQLFRKIEEFKEDRSIPVFDTCINTLTLMLLQSSQSSVLRFINEYSVRIQGTKGWHFLTMVRGVHGQDKENILAHYCDVVLEFVMRLNTETQLYERVLGIKKLLGVDSRVFPIEYDRRGIRPITTSKIQ